MIELLLAIIGGAVVLSFAVQFIFVLYLYWIFRS